MTTPTNVGADASRVTISTDWHDSRLSQAYDLINEAFLETHPESDSRALLVKAASAIEDADVELEHGR